MNPAISSFVPPVAPQMPPQAAAPAPSSQSGFSQMLNQAKARDAQPPAEAAAPEAAGAKPPHAAERNKGEKAGKADKGDKAEKATQADGERRAEKTEGEDKGEAVDSAEKPADAKTADPALADWLAAMQRPVDVPEAAAKGGLGDTEAGADTALAAKAGAARGGNGKDLKADDAADAARDLKAKAEPGREAAESSSFKAALAQADEGQRDVQPAHELPSAHNTAIAGLQPAHGGAARTGEASAPVTVQVATPAQSPEFAQALGVQVSVLAQDGIQQAELHLNPAEMGPISVQIAIDGTQAQVNFGADSAATRQIIESGLPELAASLREAGFTLSGGGVHSQARGREQGEGDGRGEPGNGGRPLFGANEAEVTPHRAVSRISAGGVDVYA